MPFWINWLWKLFGINRQFLMMLIIILLINIMIPALINIHPLFGIIIELVLFVSLFTIFIPNSHNIDDNTSGVIALLKLAKKCKDKNIQTVKFCFVDNEEIGLFGSNAYRIYLTKNKLISKNCKFISIDCVGGLGKTPLIVRNGKSEYHNIFQIALENDFGDCKSIKMILPISDNYSFKKYGAINISFTDKTIIPGGYYIRNIHSRRDKKLDIEKIEKLSNAISKII